MAEAPRAWPFANGYQDEPWFRELLEESPNVAMVLDSDLVAVRYISGAVEWVLGYRHQDIVGLRSRCTSIPKSRGGCKILSTGSEPVRQVPIRPLRSGRGTLTVPGDEATELLDSEKEAKAP